MSIKILIGLSGYKCLYDSTEMEAFGGIFYEDEDPTEFLEWLVIDARVLDKSGFNDKLAEWRVSNGQESN